MKKGEWDEVYFYDYFGTFHRSYGEIPYGSCLYEKEKKYENILSFFEAGEKTSFFYSNPFFTISFTNCFHQVFCISQFLSTYTISKSI